MRKRGRLVLRNFRARFILRCTPFSVIPITPAISLMDIPSRRLRTKASLPRRQFRDKSINGLTKKSGINTSLYVMIKLRAGSVDEVSKRFGSKGMPRTVEYEIACDNEKESVKVFASINLCPVLP